MTARGVPEIRIGLTRFVGLEALRSQRWPIACLLLSKALFWLSLTGAVWLNAFSR